MRNLGFEHLTVAARMAQARLRTLGFASWAWTLAIILGLGVFAVTAKRTYESPMPGLLTESQARARAADLLEKLRPATHAAFDPMKCRSSYAPATDKDGKAIWRFGFLSSDAGRLYQITFTGDGKFRAFSVYQKSSVLRSDDAATVISLEAARERAVGWLQFLQREAEVSPPDGASADSVSVETALAGHTRRALAWKMPERAHARSMERLELSFEGDELQLLRFREKLVEVQAIGKNLWKGLAFFAIPLVGLLPSLIAFAQGLRRREVGSKTTFAFGLLVAVWTCAGLLVTGGGALFASDLGISWHEIGESDFLSPPTIGFKFFAVFLFLTFLFFTLLVLTALNAAAAAVSESSDWNFPKPWLMDVFRVTRRRALPWTNVRAIYVVGLTLGVWLIGIDSVAQFLKIADESPMYEFSNWSKSLAAGAFPIEKLFFEQVFFLLGTTLWLLPLGGLLRRRCADWQVFVILVAVVCGLVALSSPPLSAWPVSVLIVVGVIGVLVRYGWACLAFGLTVACVAFPILWGLLHPQAFHLSFLTGVPLLLVPAALGGVKRLVPRRTRIESYDLAPPYIRARFSRERVKQELDIRWSIHQSLVPQSGIVLRDANVAAEYFHAPEQGRELFAFIPLDERRLGIAIGEVSGQGLQASMLLAITLATLKSKALRYPDSPVQVMERVNQSLAHRLAETDSQVQLVYGVADFLTGEFCYCNAGYVAPVTLHADGQERSGDARESSLHPPIGRTRNAAFVAHTQRLRPQDRLVLSSDWVCDAFDLQLGTTALEAKLRQIGEPFQTLSPREMAQGIVSYGRALQQAHGGSQMEVTIVCVRF